MPWLTPVGGGEPEYISDERLGAARSSGLYQTPSDQKATVVDPATGLAFTTAADRLGEVQDSTGFGAETEDQRIGRERTARIEDEHGGFLGAAGAFVEQGLDTATLGGYGLVSDAILGPEYTENRGERLEVHEEVGTAGTVVGAVLPSLVTGGGGAATVLRNTPAGLAARVAEKIAAKGAGKGLVAETAAAATGYGVEGALFSSGHVLAESILHDKELSAEAFVAGAEEGALWGGIGGGAGSLLSRGARAAKNKLDDVLSKNASEKTLAVEAKAAEKEARDAAKLRDRLVLQRDKALNQQALEELKVKGKLNVVEARGKSALEAIETRGKTAAEIEEIRATARGTVETTRAETRLAIADKALEKEIAKAEARLAMARQKSAEVSERLMVEQERTLRAGLVMDKRLELADKYGGHWRAVNESKELQRTIGRESVEIASDAKLRTGMADALAKSGRQDAGMLIEEMIPARLRRPEMVQAAKGEAQVAVARLTQGTDDLVRRADEIAQLNPAAAVEIQAAKQAALEATPAVSAWSQRAAEGVDDFREGFTAVRQAEQAQHDLAQTLAPYLDDVDAAQVQQMTRGMDEAVAKSEDIIADSIKQNVDAVGGKAAGEAGGATDTAAIADLMLSAGGLPSADDIPVVGPVLGAYLKFRAASGALGKMGIRLPGAVGKIAQTGASIQNKAAEVVGALVQRAPAVAKTIERAAAPTLVMSRPLWEPEEGQERRKDATPDSPHDLYRKRVNEIERAVADVDGTRARILESVPAPPQVANAIADAKIRKLEYLAGEIPKDPRPPTVRQRPYVPNPAEMRRFTEKVFATEYPVDAMSRVFDGQMSPSAADAVRAVYPRLFQQMQEELVERMAASDDPPDRDKLVRAALVFDVPLDPSVMPAFFAARQAEYAAAKQQAQPQTGGGPQLALSNQEELGVNRRATR